MYKDRTQNYYPEIHEEIYQIHPSSCHIVLSLCADNSIHWL